MNKLLLFAAAIVAISVASCGNSGSNGDAPIQADTIYINENDVTVTPVDSDSVLVTDVQTQAVATNQ